MWRHQNVSRWCNGSMSVSKTVGRGSSPWRDAKYKYCVKYIIIEDCSPYYIKFSWEGMLETIDFIATQKLNPSNNRDVGAYTHHNFDVAVAQAIIDKLPMKDKLEINEERTALFITRPRVKCALHKDGSNIRCGINIPISIVDDQCVTSWYADKELDERAIFGLPYTRKILLGIMPPPTKSTVMKSNEAILFNTEIFHDFDNSKSDNERTILTLRFKDPEDIYFEDVKSILFGNVAESGLLQQS